MRVESEVDDPTILAMMKELRRRDDWQASRENWMRAWRQRANNYGRAVDSGLIPSGHYESERWIDGREIRVFTDGMVREPAVGPVVTGIKEMVRDIDLDLKVRYFPDLGNHPSVTGPVRLSTVNGMLDPQKIELYFATEIWRQPPQGSQHADVLVTNLPLSLGGENFGYSLFHPGCSVISLTDGTTNPSDRRNRQDPRMYDLVRRIAKHETGHLIGYDLHHESIPVSGYSEPDDCLMYWRCSTDRICDKCRDAITGLWEGLEQKTGTKYFR